MQQSNEKGELIGFQSILFVVTSIIFKKFEAVNKIWVEGLILVFSFAANRAEHDLKRTSLTLRKRAVEGKLFEVNRKLTGLSKPWTKQTHESSDILADELKK